jgi:hypothetical protein
MLPGYDTPLAGHEHVSIPCSTTHPRQDENTSREIATRIGFWEKNLELMKRIVELADRLKIALLPVCS